MNRKKKISIFQVSKYAPVRHPFSLRAQIPRRSFIAAGCAPLYFSFTAIKAPDLSAGASIIRNSNQRKRNFFSCISYVFSIAFLPLKSLYLKQKNSEEILKIKSRMQYFPPKMNYLQIIQGASGHTPRNRRWQNNPSGSPLFGSASCFRPRRAESPRNAASHYNCIPWKSHEPRCHE